LLLVIHLTPPNDFIKILENFLSHHPDGYKDKQAKTKHKFLGAGNDETGMQWN